MSHQPIRLGVVGLGNIFHGHLKAIIGDERFRIVAVCDSDPARTESVRSALETRPFSDHRKMLSLDFDVLVICLPHHLHATVAAEAFAAGKHALIEKPMAQSLQECRQLLEASRRAQRHLVVAEVASFDPGAVMTGSRFRSGSLGRFLCSSNVNIRDYFTRERPKWYLDPSQSGGGMFANLGVHRLALMRAALPTLKPRFVTATVHRLPMFPVEACTHAMVQYDQGGVVTYEEVGYFPCPTRLQKIHHLVFEEGIVSWNCTSWELLRREGQPLDEQPLTPVTAVYGPVYNGLFETLTDNYTGPGPHEYVEDLAVLHAVEQSAATNRRIDLFESMSE